MTMDPRRPSDFEDPLTSSGTDTTIVAYGPVGPRVLEKIVDALTHPGDVDFVSPDFDGRGDFPERLARAAEATARWVGIVPGGRPPRPDTCHDCGRAPGSGHARNCQHPDADLDRHPVAPAWLSPASYRHSTDSLRERQTGAGLCLCANGPNGWQIRSACPVHGWARNGPTPFDQAARDRLRHPTTADFPGLMAARIYERERERWRRIAAHRHATDGLQRYLEWGSADPPTPRRRWPFLVALVAIVALASVIRFRWRR